MQQRSALETALKWMERADRSRLEIQTYLEKKGFSESETTETLNKIQEYGYLNDEFLATRVTTALRNSLQGELKIQQKLEQRGLDPVNIQADSTSRALTLLQKKFKDQNHCNDPKIWSKAARHLASQGYTEEEIESAISKFFPNIEI